ncbi:hypothetical protein NPIL_583011 [Nephila pilipes]|uniref:Uncharacterized protein n=1 Tax=Nephila pilipes TaxID=299642 RepID=A0A8X6U083_NEPPI|nr:hypothetical protein NPIL_583011 [Nephila pilipes]
MEATSGQVPQLQYRQCSVQARGYFPSSFLLLNNDLDMNLDQTKDLESARNMEPGDEKSLRRDTPITTDNSQENCKLRNTTKS